MSLLTTFPAAANVAVIGSSGGIGSAMLQLLSADERVARIHAFSRTGNTAELPKVIARRIDVEDESSIAEAASSVVDSLSLIHI